MRQSKRILSNPLYLTYLHVTRWEPSVHAYCLF